MKAMTLFDWKRFFIQLYKRSIDADVFSRASQVAFYLFFALFPLLFFLVSLFGMVLGSSGGLKDELFEYIGQIAPTPVFALVEKTVVEIVANSSGGKATLGLIIALWSASAGIDAIRNALNAVYELKETRSWWLTKLQSLGLTLVIAILTTFVLAIVFYGWQLVQWGLAGVGFEVTSPFVLVAIQWASILLVMLLACEIIYNLLPAFEKFKWAWITPGSIVAIILWIVLTNGLRAYLGYFNSYNKAYGSLGAVMMMMLWLYLTATALMIGGAINSVVAEIQTPTPKST